MATPFHVEIVTPERTLFSGDAEEVSMRTEDGEIAFLARHEDFIGACDVTVVRITTLEASTSPSGEPPPGLHAGAAAPSGQQGAVSVPAGTPAGTRGGATEAGEVRVAVHGGFVNVDQDANSVQILAGVAELASEIDVERARRALETAEVALAQAPAADTAAALEAGDHPGGLHASALTIASLDPDAPEAAVKRARVRLEAAGASVNS